MRILELILAASALIATPVVVQTAWADCNPDTFPFTDYDERSVDLYCYALAECSDERFEHADCVDWHLAALALEDDAPVDGGGATVQLNCYDSDDYLADPTVCDSECGDGVCSGGEDATSCAADCGVCGGPTPPPAF